ncbi:High mobility group B protein 1 [Cocos nucifera]|uniref:High mobility group B protein 1 n=1 Tax=Cocos nucifera TaxID=13894 RepID=A0A8K0MZK2_COCNU|nr:High mobility group B protein 1 [Cocos nucifera]
MKGGKGKGATKKETKEVLKPADDSLQYFLFVMVAYDPSYLLSKLIEPMGHGNTEFKKVGKRKAAIKADKSSKRQAKKEKMAKKDPNKPKRPSSAFFVFLEEFRKQYKQEHPNVKAVSVVGKAGGEKWKSMSDAEKAPYEAKAAKRKSEYEKQMSAYNKKQESVTDDGDEESDRSKSEVDEEESGEILSLILLFGDHVLKAKSESLVSQKSSEE